MVLFVFLPLEAAFYKFSTLLLITFDPIARFRSIFLKTVCIYETHPSKGFLSLQRQRHCLQYAFCDVTKLQKAGLLMIRSQMD